MYYKTGIYETATQDNKKVTVVCLTGTSYREGDVEYILPKQFTCPDGSPDAGAIMDYVATGKALKLKEFSEDNGCYWIHTSTPWTRLRVF